MDAAAPWVRLKPVRGFYCGKARGDQLREWQPATGARCSVAARRWTVGLAGLVVVFVALASYDLISGGTAPAGPAPRAHQCEPGFRRGGGLARWFSAPRLAGRSGSGGEHGRGQRVRRGRQRAVSGDDPGQRPVRADLVHATAAQAAGRISGQRLERHRIWHQGDIIRRSRRKSSSKLDAIRSCSITICL